MRKRKKISQIIFLLSLTLILITAVFSISRSYEADGKKWFSGNIPVRYYINPSNGNIPESDFVNAVLAGKQKWNDISGLNFSFSYQGTTNTGYNLGDGVNVWVWNPTGSGMGSNTLALTHTYYYTQSLEIIECDVEFNGLMSWDWKPSTSSPYDVQSVVTHEAGHWLWLGHTGDTNAVMYPTYSGQRELGQDDINGIISLYGASSPTPTITPTVSPTSTPTITPTTSPTSEPDPGGGGGGGGGGCFIATAAYGSYMDANVMHLRRFRDNVLMQSSPGRALVNLYYRTSPPAAEFIAEHKVMRAITRTVLTPIVYTVAYPWIAIPLFVFFVIMAYRLKKRKYSTEVYR